ncbi:hypothetical protein PCASD_26537 [Puccinia coronata f. sp. avenae]|uniref:Uncharacterized protein n=1 Tax=Puccinia coronata f. sp. avenae TaxID=200324 RepID=A0A2N5TH65_9BASI|nr:hypothetical protein PCASD_26537 [Puccinia coronata f. sp. avenae]
MAIGSPHRPRAQKPLPPERRSRPATRPAGGDLIEGIDFTTLAGTVARWFLPEPTPFRGAAHTAVNRKNLLKGRGHG